VAEPAAKQVLGIGAILNMDGVAPDVTTVS
jgi:hypothetical protein